MEIENCELCHREQPIDTLLLVDNFEICEHCCADNTDEEIREQLIALSN